MRIRVFVNERGTHALPDDLSQLPSVEVECTAEMTLYEVGEAAAEEMGISLHSPSLLFTSAPDDEGKRRPVPYPRAYVGPNGHLKWAMPSRRATVGDIGRTAAEGLFSGDTTAFVYEESTIGDSGLVFLWHELLQLLDRIESSGGGAVLVWESAKALKNLLLRHYKRWRSEGARTPSSLFEVILSREEWDGLHLARLLGLTEHEAVELLAALGFEGVGDGRFHASDDPRRTALREQLLEKVIEYDPASWKRPVITVHGVDYEADYEEQDEDDDD